jgi:hypothetical protein
LAGVRPDRARLHPALPVMVAAHRLRAGWRLPAGDRRFISTCSATSTSKSTVSRWSFPTGDVSPHDVHRHPNMAWVFGYFPASWTLRADLAADFVCRLLKHMQATRAQRVEVQLWPEDRDMLAPSVDRSGELQSRLPDARLTPAAKARRQTGMAAHPRLLDRVAPNSPTAEPASKRRDRACGVNTARHFQILKLFPNLQAPD